MAGRNRKLGRVGRGGVRMDALERRQLLAATVIDVMVLYDVDAKAQFGNSDAAIQKAIGQSIDIANLAHQNTGDNVVLRMVHTELLNYSNPGAAQSVQLAALEANSTVAALRNTWGADLVSIVINSAEGGGLGDLLTVPGGSSSEAFSVVGYESMSSGSLVLAHELGHNMGAGHERDNATQFSQGAFPAYSFGYHTAEDGASNHGTDYGDVMSYQGQTLPVFSNPNYTHDGVPLGRPIGSTHAADLLSTFNVTAPAVAAYRATVVANAAPTATLWQADINGDQLTFQVRFVDDVSVSAATLDSGDVYVTTPEGFHLQAEFVKADSAGDAYSKVATYRVTLPRNAPALSSLGFVLNAGQVKDVNNAAVAGGTLAVNLDGDLERGFGQLAIARDSGAMATGTTRTITNRIGESGDSQDIYRLTVTANMKLSLSLTGLGGALASDPVLFLYADANLNEVVDGGEDLGNSFETGTADKTMSVALTPGTYYVYLQLTTGHAATNYTLTMRTVDSSGDVTPPSLPVLDKADEAFAGTSTTLDFYVVYTDNVGMDPASVKSKGYLIFFNPTGSGIIKTPADVTVSGKSVIAHYTHTFANAFGSGTVQVKLSDQAGFTNQATDLAGNPIGGLGTIIGTYKVGTLTSDVSAPTATLSSATQVVVPSPLPYDFVVAYKDNRGISAATIDGSDIRVVGPGAINLSASVVPGSITTNPGGAITYVTYRITPPGGAWDFLDDGNYSVVLQAAQVKDAAGNSAGSAVSNTTVGAFNVHVAYPGDANGDDTVGFADLVTVAQNYGLVGRGVATGDFDFDGVVGFSDLVAVAQRYDTSLPPPQPGAALLSAESVVAAVLATRPTATVKKPAATTPTKVPAAVAKPKAVVQPVVAAAPKGVFGTTRVGKGKSDLLA